MKDACFGNKISINQRRYLGSKKKLLPFIESILDKKSIKYDSFADIFAGTGVVGDHFSTKSNVILNDILESNFLSHTAFLGAGKLNEKKMLSFITEFNELNPDKLTNNYFSNNFSGTYFDHCNSLKIGYIREQIDELYEEKKLAERERAYLITALIYGMDRIANTVGHYDAYRKISFDQKPLKIRPLLITKGPHKVKVYKQDANILVRKISADVVYIDPPYNSRQYSDAYHLLENVANWEKPIVKGVAKKFDRTNIKSNYSMKSAGAAFSDLIENIEAKYILVSYNDMGTSGAQRSQSCISDNELISALENKGLVEVFETDFTQFSTGKSKNDNLKERVFLCEVKKNKSSGPAILMSTKNLHLPKFVKSPLNYTGGKHKLLPQITDFFPKDIKVFYDVFSGGGNVGINAEANEIVCIDKNSKVVDLLNFIKNNNYEAINQGILSVIKKYNLSESYLNGYSTYGCESSAGLGKYNKEPYLKLREAYNDSRDELMMLVLILYSFNNQIRFNSKGNFNLPVGKRDYNGSSRKNIAAFNTTASQKNIKFAAGDFRDLQKMKFNKKDFIYLDPPYLLGLASYNESDGWNENDETELYKLLESLTKKNIKFALSNVIEHKGEVNTQLEKFIKNNNLKLNKISHSYSNSNYQSKAKENHTQEVLITNY